MILTDQAIKEALAQGVIEIEPFNAANLGSNSYDVTLAPDILIFEGNELDPRQDQSHLWNPMRMHESGYLLQPFQPVLASTNERTFTPRHVPIITGKSSIGRNFLSVHQTAGFGDVGFNGYWTLELSAVAPVWIYPGMKIGQISFWQVAGECESSYLDKKDASYKEQYAKAEPVPSKLYLKPFFKNINSK